MDTKDRIQTYRMKEGYVKVKGEYFLEFKVVFYGDKNHDFRKLKAYYLNKTEI